MVPGDESVNSLSASQLKRLAEAVDGMRDGKSRWFVLDAKTPTGVRVFADQAAAQAAAKDPGSVLTGPFRTDPDQTAAKRRIQKIQVYYEGSEKPVEATPDQVDAVFMTLAALDKFVFPYYCQLYGAEQAARMREAYVASSEPGFFHTPWTEDEVPTS